MRAACSACRCRCRGKVCRPTWRRWRWTKTAANGRTVKISFCSDCGVRLFHEPARNPKIVNVKPGTLDDTAWVRPMGHLWLDSAQPWFTPPSDALHYAGQPDSFDDLFARFDAYLADITDQR